MFLSLSISFLAISQTLDKLVTVEKGTHTERQDMTQTRRLGIGVCVQYSLTPVGQWHQQASTIGLIFGVIWLVLELREIPREKY